MKGLFLALDPPSVASTRYRICQYLPFFEKSGIDCQLQTYGPIGINGALRRPTWVEKPLHFLKKASEFRELISGKHDFIFISRLLLPFSQLPILPALRRSRIPIVYDIDDSVFSDQPHSVRQLMKISHTVIAGNKHLLAYALPLNPQAQFLPTSVDCSVYRPIRKRESACTTLGWIGSPSATPYLGAIAPAIRALAKSHEIRLLVMGVSSGFSMPGVRLEIRPWRLEDEVSFFEEIDIGLYPLQHDEWCLGKCAFKAVQYMATGTPFVASRIGANIDVVTDGHDGLFASNGDEWLCHLRRLIESEALRNQLAENGRRTAENRFSVQSNLPAYLDIFRRLADDRRRLCVA